MYEMLAHNANIDPEIFTTIFIDGLKDEFRSVVVIQQLEDLDAPSSLAIMHEGLLKSLKHEDNKRRDASDWAKAMSVF
jgi:hypothetical protein